MRKLIVKQKSFTYNINDPLGVGAYGTVYLATDNSDQSKVAIKVMQFTKEIDINNYMNEVKIMESLRSISYQYQKFFVRLHDYAIDRLNKRLIMVIEYCNLGDMETYLKKNKELDEKKALGLISQIIYALKILKSINIMHRDLKPSNIMLNYDNYTNNIQIKLTDFGSSTILENLNSSKVKGGSLSSSKVKDGPLSSSKIKDSPNKLMDSYIGTPLYMSPQILKRENYSSKSDIWSLGMIFYQMVFNKLPWMASNINDYMDILDKKLPIPFPKNINVISDASKEFITKCLQYDEDARFTWDELFKHEILKKHFENIENGLRQDESTLKELNKTMFDDSLRNKSTLKTKNDEEDNLIKIIEKRFNVKNIKILENIDPDFLENYKKAESIKKNRKIIILNDEDYDNSMVETSEVKQPIPIKIMEIRGFISQHNSKYHRRKNNPRAHIDTSEDRMVSCEDCLKLRF